MPAPTRQVRSVRTAAGVQDKPAPIAMNFDVDDDAPPIEPFVIVLGGDRIVFADAMDMDWQELTAAMNNTRKFLRMVLSEVDAAKFLSTKIPAKKIRRMIALYAEHYGMTETVDE